MMKVEEDNEKKPVQPMYVSFFHPKSFFIGHKHIYITSTCIFLKNFLL